jgi:ribonuclease-3
VKEREIIKLETELGYKFKQRELLMRALTHSSFANQERELGLESNERQEFLGDSLLGAIVAEHLFLNFKTLSEGKMSKLKASLVCEDALNEIAKELGIGKYLLLGKGEEKNGGRNRKSNLADSIEAIIAAIYLDGGIEPAKVFVGKFVLSGVKAQDALRAESSDYKTSLQELRQKTENEYPQYELVSESGPDHQKTFVAAVFFKGKELGRGRGKSKKEAEQEAAKQAIERQIF